MTQEQTEGNELIAGFVNYPLKSIPQSIYPLRYHTSWDWLMPVVEKIRDIPFEDLQLLEEAEEYDRFKHMRIWADITNVWQAVVKFVQWYNQNKQS